VSSGNCLFHPENAPQSLAISDFSPHHQLRFFGVGDVILPNVIRECKCLWLLVPYRSFGDRFIIRCPGGHQIMDCSIYLAEVTEIGTVKPRHNLKKKVVPRVDYSRSSQVAKRERRISVFRRLRVVFNT
jgi:hypothetical protein